LKDKLSVEFKNKCFKDIEEIYGEIEAYVPELQLWQMQQSVVIDDNAKVLCRAILDNEDKISGYQVKIDVFGEDECKYRLVILENSLEYTKDYIEDGSVIRELYKSELDGASINRMCIYQKNHNYLKYDEKFDANSKFNDWDSYSDIIDELKMSLNLRKNKVRER